MEVTQVPIATPEVYTEMLKRAKEHSFAFPAINCTSSETINAAIKGFADAGSDGIINSPPVEPSSARVWVSRTW